MGYYCVVTGIFSASDEAKRVYERYLQNELQAGSEEIISGRVWPHYELQIDFGPHITVISLLFKMLANLTNIVKKRWRIMAKIV